MRTPFTTILSITTILLATFGFELRAQDALQGYIDTGLKNNLVLQQKDIALEKAMLALKIADGMFLPSLSVQGSYTSGSGGRSIALPIGDMLNPVYATLNQLTSSDKFPQIENVNQNFFPQNFYDAKVRTSMPLFNTDLIYNRKIKQQQGLLQEFELQTYKRELVRNIKTAYYTYLSAQQVLTVYNNALTRALEGKRVNESLLANGKGLPAYILRSESEIETIKAQIVDGERQLDNAKVYFNFLLNRELTETIDINYAADATLAGSSLLLDAEFSAQQREESKQVQTLLGLNQEVLSMNRNFWTPRVSAYLDLGSQAQGFRYDNHSRYYLTGVQLEIPLFAGYTNRHKINQSKLEIKNTELSAALLTQQLTMSANVSRNAVISAYQNYQSAQKQFAAAQSYQKLIEKGYKEGVNTFIETIDARNQLTNAQLLVNINQNKVLIALASLERETASYNFN